MRAFNALRKIVSFADFVELKEKHEELRNAILAVLSHEKEQNKYIQTLGEEVQFIDDRFTIESDRLNKMLAEQKFNKIEIVVITKEDSEGNE